MMLIICIIKISVKQLNYERKKLQIKKFTEKLENYIRPFWLSLYMKIGKAFKICTKSYMIKPTQQLES